MRLTIFLILWQLDDITTDPQEVLIIGLVYYWATYTNYPYYMSFLFYISFLGKRSN